MMLMLATSTRRHAADGFSTVIFVPFLGLISKKTYRETHFCVILLEPELGPVNSRKLQHSC